MQLYMVEYLFYHFSLVFLSFSGFSADIADEFTFMYGAWYPSMNWDEYVYARIELTHSDVGSD